MKSALFSSGLLACLFFSAAAFAQSSGSDQTPPQGEGHRHGPPPQAIAACTNKAASDTCSFTRRNGDVVNGQCMAPHPKADGDGATGSSPPLACRPAHAHDKAAQSAGSGH